MARDTNGRFKKGHDSSRHVFTKAECQAGFWAALESIVTRHPEWKHKSGDHIVTTFLSHSGRGNGLPKRKRERKSEERRKRK